MNEKCFALQRNEECRALDKNCHGHCAFYKPVWKHKKERRLANVKLSALPVEKQIHIADKYSAGCMPWEEEME